MIFYIVRRLCSKAIFRLHENTWLVVLILLGSLYAGGYIGMSLLREVDVAQNYTWWFWVTITTVGYGDHAPSTPGGRAIGIIIMFVGIGTIGLVIGKIAESVIDIASIKAKGMGCMKHRNHIIIMGYRDGSTEKVIAELLIHNPDQKIVLCSRDQESNPLLKFEIDFVKGELSSEDVLQRANAAEAKSVVIHGKDDDATFFTAYAFREVNTSAHMVCYLTNENHSNKIRNLPADDKSFNQVVLPANVYLMAQELEDRESSAVIHSLISNLAGDNLYRYDIPQSDTVDCAFYDAFTSLKRHYGLTVVALKAEELIVNPDLDERVRSGMSLFYTARSRLSSIDFNVVRGEHE